MPSAPSPFREILRLAARRGSTIWLGIRATTVLLFLLSGDAALATSLRTSVWTVGMSGGLLLIEELARFRERVFLANAGFHPLTAVMASTGVVALLEVLAAIGLRLTVIH